MHKRYQRTSAILRYCVQHCTHKRQFKHKSLLRKKLMLLCCGEQLPAVPASDLLLRPLAIHGR